jgi:hypothetical protein
MDIVKLCQTANSFERLAAKDPEDHPTVPMPAMTNREVMGFPPIPKAPKLPSAVEHKSGEFAISSLARNKAIKLVELILHVSKHGIPSSEEWNTIKIHAHTLLRDLG